MKLNHLFIPYLAVLIFMFGGIVTSGGIAWYDTLLLPSWHPSTGIIAFIWGVIYVCAAWSLIIVWNRVARGARFNSLMGLFGICMALNLIWSIVFFRLHLILLSAATALVLGVCVLVLALLLYPHSRKAAFLLLPYAAWVLFAAFLNYCVFTLNP